MSFDLSEARARLDPGGMFDAVRSFPHHFQEGWVRAADLQPRHRAVSLEHVLILGMGGSAIGADLLRAYALRSSSVPITVVRDYRIPAWVNDQTLVVASSYSGDTEETLAALESARERGAAVYVVSSGGQLLRQAQEADLPHVVLPTGLQPRAALGYSFAALLRIADKLGLVALGDHEFEHTAAALEQNADRLARQDGRAREIAEVLHDRLTVVYTGPGLLEPVGLRWRTQIQENAKQLAYGNVFAEMNHNEIMGWQHAPADLRKRVTLIVLRDRDDHPQIRRRMDVTHELLAGRAGGWVEHEAQETWPLARMLTTLQLGDFVSVFLAFQAGVDPTPVETIQRLKGILAGG